MKNDYRRFDFLTIKKYCKTVCYIKINGDYIEVSKHVYVLCRNSYRKINRDNNRDKKILYHYENFEMSNNHIIPNQNPSIIEQIYKDSQIKKLYKVINELPEIDRKIIISIYFENWSERETAFLLHLPHTTLHNKKNKILKQLRKFLDQDEF